MKTYIRLRDKSQNKNKIQKLNINILYQLYIFYYSIYLLLEKNIFCRTKQIYQTFYYKYLIKQTQNIIVKSLVLIYYIINKVQSINKKYLI